MNILKLALLFINLFKFFFNYILKIMSPFQWKDDILNKGHDNNVS